MEYYEQNQKINENWKLSLLGNSQRKTRLKIVPPRNSMKRTNMLVSVLSLSNPLSMSVENESSDHGDEKA